MIRNFFRRKKQAPTGGTQDAKAEMNRNSPPGFESPLFSPINPLPSAEQLCGIDPGKMTTEEIRDQLKKLYKRHNEAAASLNRELRDEAESMLNAIVVCQEKYIDR
jgi:hypothetical protein